MRVLGPAHRPFRIKEPAIALYAAAHQIVIVKSYIDPGGSGLTLRERPAGVPADLLSTLGNRIRQRRTRAGWTQVQLAERIGIDRSFLADWGPLQVPTGRR